jgi:hypothetical protein
MWPLKINLLWRYNEGYQRCKGPGGQDGKDLMVSSIKIISLHHNNKLFNYESIMDSISEGRALMFQLLSKSLTSDIATLRITFNI